MQTNTTSCSHPLTLASMPLPLLVSALPGSATTTTQSLVHAKLGLTAMPRPRSSIKIITSASLPTPSLSSTVPTRTSTSTLLHASARPSPCAMRARDSSVTLAMLLPTVINPSTKSPSKPLVTTSTLVIPNALVATVSALKTDAPMSTSSPRLKDGSPSPMSKATKRSLHRTIPLLTQQQSGLNGMICIKLALAFTTLLAAGEHGESREILVRGISALSRTPDNGTKKVLPTYKACLSACQVRLRSTMSPKLELNILSIITQSTGVSAFRPTAAQAPLDPSFPIRTAIWTE